MRALRLALIGTFGLLGLSGSAYAVQKLTIMPASPINAGAPQQNMTNTIPVTVSNTGDANLTVKSISQPAAPFSLTGLPQLPGILPPGGAFTFNLNFTPMAMGMFTGSFTVLSDDGGNPNASVTITVNGSSGNPVIMGIKTVFFAPTRVGANSSPPTNFDITNTGLGDLKINSYFFGGTNPNDFKVLQSPQTPYTIAPGKTQTIQLVFSPTGLNPPNRSGQLTIQSNDGNQPNFVVSMSGTATQAMLSAAPGNLDFMTQQMFLASNPKTVTMTNAGNGDANVKSVTFTGQNPMSFALSAPPVFPAKVPANGGTLALNVVAVPLVNGSNTAVMHINYDDPMKAEDTVNVTVNGIAGSVALNNPYVDFGPTPINPNPAPSKMVVITNKGNNDLQIINALIDDPQMTNAFDSMKVNMLQNNMGFPVVIKPNATYAFDVVFQPQVPMQFQASLNLDFEGDPMAKHVHVPLAGIGTMAGLSVTPMNGMLPFPATRVGMFSLPQKVTLTNTGGTTIDVQSVTLGGATPQAFQIDQMGPFKIDPGKAVDINVTFQPLTGGAASATMTITVLGLTPVNIKLTGTGSTIQIGIAPMSIDFGMVTVGTPSDPAVVGMKNGGMFDIKFSSISSTDPAFTVNTSTTAMTLKQGATTTFQVTAIPGAVGAKSGVIKIAVDGQEVGTVPVTVTGVAPVKRMASGCALSTGPSQLPIALLLLVGGLALAVAAPRVRRALRRR